jgi:hypothetical protein
MPQANVLSLGIILGWVSSLLVAVSFLPALEGMGIGGIFMIFGVFTVLALTLVIMTMVRRGRKRRVRGGGVHCAGTPALIIMMMEWGGGREGNQFMGSRVSMPLLERGEGCGVIGRNRDQQPYLGHAI